MVAEFRRRRDAIVDGLNEIPGDQLPMPHGAFYVFPNITKLGRPADEVANRLLSEGGVALLAGTAFGKAGEGYLRLSYAASLANIEEALDRIARVVEGLD